MAITLDGQEHWWLLQDVHHTTFCCVRATGPHKAMRALYDLKRSTGMKLMNIVIVDHEPQEIDIPEVQITRIGKKLVLKTTFCCVCGVKTWWNVKGVNACPQCIHRYQMI